MLKSLFQKEPVIAASAIGLLLQAGEAINLVNAGQVDAIQAGGFGAALAIVQVVVSLLIRSNVFSPHTVSRMKQTADTVADTLPTTVPALPTTAGVTK